MGTGTKIIHLMRGGQDGLEFYTSKSLKKGEVFWVPSQELMDTLSGRTFAEIEEMLDDPHNEKYLPYESHLIAYLMDGEMKSEGDTPKYRYVECPELTNARILAREHYNQEQ